MFLRSLTLKGFKSFAEPTTIELEPGVTAVVGPNGSGKSNVVDAVAWVLGAQGPRSMRSGRMDDVIFAGNARRQALGRAEVSLTIDNSSGLLPIEFSEVTLTRTLFRSSGESDYAINGAPCRLLDVQELLSDTGVGRQQHVIVSQGQLEAVLDARPEDRRLIVEEAAGILKYRRRKEKAERRLAATEANLIRLTDLAREVARQQKPLERQAEAARRYGRLAAETRQLRLHLAGREVLALTARQEAARAAGAQLNAEEACVGAELAALDDEVSAAETALMDAGRSPVGHTLGRLEALRERARGLVAVLAERSRSVERDRAAQMVAADTGQGAALEADSLRLGEDAEETEQAIALLAGRMEALAAEDGALADAATLGCRLEALDAEAMGAGDQGGAGRGGSVADVAADGEALRERSGRVRGELRALESGVARSEAELGRIEGRFAALAARRDRLGEAQAAASVRRDAAAADEHRLAASLEEAIAARDTANEALSQADEEVAAGAACHQAARARVEALAMALERSQPAGGTEPEVGPGIVGTLASLVRVEPGWAAAVEAVVADAATMVVADGVVSAQALLSRSSLPAGAPSVVALGVVPAPDPPRPTTGGQGRPLRDLVRPARTELAGALDPLLDHLLAGVVAVDGGWELALDTFLANPTAVVVTRSGDRFSTTGWRVGGRGGHAVRQALDAADVEVETAARSLGECRQHRATLAAAADRARSRHDGVTARRRDASTRLSSARASFDRIEAEDRALALEAAGVADRRDELLRRLESERSGMAELLAVLPGLEADEAEARRRQEADDARRRAHLDRIDALARRRVALETEAAALAERRRSLEVQRQAVRQRQGLLTEAATAARLRSAELDTLARRLGQLAVFAGARLASIETALHELRERGRREDEDRRRLVESLDKLRRGRQSLEAASEGLRERLRRAEREEAEAAIRLESATEALRRDLDCEPSVAAALDCPPLPDGAVASTHLRELERELRLLGPINPLAIEELTALRERHDFLTAQLDDVRAGRRELSKVIRAVEASMLEQLTAAYADVAVHFDRLFQTLFPGGQGRLRLTDPDNPLETGIEIEARPAGKNVRRLSLLSGGERSLCAMAFLFAVFRSRPSPFYLLDEVEAALDDVNLHRFLDLLAEFRNEAQLLIVTHQKRTMDAADCLHGVTMAPGGSSKVVSERLRSATPASGDPVAIS